LLNHISNPVFSTEVELRQVIKVNDLESFPWAKEFADSEKSLFVRIAYEDDEEIRMPFSPVDNDMEAGFVNFFNKG